MSTQEVKSPKDIVNSKIREQKEKGVYHGFPVGKKVPNFEADTADGGKIEIHDMIGSNDFLIINFFRGTWCGYCKNELNELKDAYDRITDLHGDVVSIAPQSVSRLAEMKQEKNLPFTILADPNLELAKSFNLIWEIPEEIQEVYLEEFDLNIPELNANGSWHLPVPATYVVNRNGDVLAKFEDLNYSNRMPAGDIIAVLEKYQ